MSVDVDIAVRLGRDDFRLPTEWSPDELDRAIADDVYGRLRFRSPEHGEGFLEDDLVPLVAGVCFQSMEYLAAGRPWAAFATRYPGDIKMFRDGGRITVALDDDAVFTAPATELLPALVDGGRRAIEALRPVLERRPAGQEEIANLEALAGEAEEALASAQP